ncbi:unnamed protein product [Soboliphyme baturini]|uniref:Uncharacterized protein n=1 Tax=Soboliphyme baturini TaxID=241478 RepID=A0A183IKZ6_9BILA|nr:unnamed protein product [Soboliphyme baturini]
MSARRLTDQPTDRRLTTGTTEEVDTEESLCNGWENGLQIWRIDATQQQRDHEGVAGFEFDKFGPQRKSLNKLEEQALVPTSTSQVNVYQGSLRDTSVPRLNDEGQAKNLDDRKEAVFLSDRLPSKWPLSIKRRIESQVPPKSLAHWRKSKASLLSGPQSDGWKDEPTDGRTDGRPGDGGSCNCGESC